MDKKKMDKKMDEKKKKGTILATATRFLPAILVGLVTGTTDQDVEGSRMFLGSILTKYNMLKKDC